MQRSFVRCVNLLVLAFQTADLKLLFTQDAFLLIDRWVTKFKAEAAPVPRSAEYKQSLYENMDRFLA